VSLGTLNNDWPDFFSLVARVFAESVWRVGRALARRNRHLHVGEHKLGVGEPVRNRRYRNRLDHRERQPLRRKIAYSSIVTPLHRCGRDANRIRRIATLGSYDPVALARTDDLRPLGSTERTRLPCRRVAELLVDAGHR